MSFLCVVLRKNVELKLLNKGEVGAGQMYSKNWNSTGVASDKADRKIRRAQ
jgi:hypothetical protein